VRLAIGFLATWMIVWSAHAANLSTWNGKSVGSTPGNIGAVNGKQLGTSAGNTASWNGVNVQGGGSCTPGTQIFTYTGADQSFVVPANCTSITVKLWGGGGGAVEFNNGGGGGYSTGAISVTPGATLTIKVGGAGGASAGWPNGGARGAPGFCSTATGGGSSSVLSGSTVLVEAGGGGGGTGDLCDCGGGNGCPGQPAGGTTSCTPFGNRTGGAGQESSGGGGGGYCAGSGGVNGYGGGGGYSFFPIGGTQIAGSGTGAGNKSEAPCSNACGNSGQSGIVYFAW